MAFFPVVAHWLVFPTPLFMLSESCDKHLIVTRNNSRQQATSPDCNVEHADRDKGLPFNVIISSYPRCMQPLESPSARQSVWQSAEFMHLRAT
ncbi:hypothetical protein HOLleu_23697 [Holothuria leucospilota]|uniref:Secreted protein n=1 Tax=Holothuria leucospilota TaxID=206669 RepID=A0A9Q1BV77_HOLLE|nr:hypothetical protein HOLleu_23697 [Holothuria leucospilota]